jgi:cytochrome c556
MQTSRWMICFAFMGALACACAVAKAQDLPRSEVIKNRIANFREIGTAFKGIRDELKSKEPYLPSIQESARQIESLGAEIPMWFPAGTGPVAEPDKGLIDTVLGWFSSDDATKNDGKTKAKPVVWTQWTRFQRAHQKFLAEALKMNAAAQSGDKAAVAAQFKVVGGACKNCHDTFREKVAED